MTTKETMLWFNYQFAENHITYCKVVSEVSSFVGSTVWVLFDELHFKEIIKISSKKCCVFLPTSLPWCNQSQGGPSLSLYRVNYQLTIQLSYPYLHNAPPPAPDPLDPTLLMMELSNSKSDATIPNANFWRETGNVSLIFIRHLCI